MLFLSQNKKKDIATQVTSGDLIMPRSFIYKLSQQGLRILTRIHSNSFLDTLISILNESYGKLLRRHHMPLRHQVIMLFMKLKLNLSFSALSVLFECSSTTRKTIFVDVIQHLSKHLKCAIAWLSKDEILQRMPNCLALYKRD